VKIHKGLVLLLAFIFLAASGCKRQPVVKVASHIKPIRVKEVIKEPHTQAISSSGNIKPAQTVKLSMKVSGTINSLPVNIGDYVKKGQCLASIDPLQYQLALNAADSEYLSLKMKIESEIPSGINQAKSQLDLMNNRYARYKQLYEKGLLPKDKFEELETELIVIRNKYQEALDSQAVWAKKLKQAKAMSALSRTNFNDTKLYSPINGVVVSKLVESGEMAAPGYPLLVLGKLEQVEVEIGVTDEVVNRLELGKTAAVYVYGPEETYYGKIAEIGAIADEQTRTFPVKILLNNPRNQLKPGMIAKVNIPLDSAAVILAPVNSIINSSAGPIVYVYDAKKTRVFQRKVKLGEMIKDQIVITGGLKAGETIVTGGHFKLKNKDQVMVKGWTK
jgi:RND family efflux transporter MFP subunit